MTFPLLGKSYFFACAAIAAQSRKARCKNSRSAERGCSSVHPPPNRRRMGGGSNLAHHQQAIAAQSREARCKNSRSAERCARRRVSERNRRRRHLAQSEDVPLFTRRRTGGEWVEVATLPTTNRLSPRNRAKRGAKTAGAQSAAPADAFRSATAAGGTWRGDRMFLCSPAAEQAANGWRRQPGPTAGEAANPAPLPTSYRHAAQSWHLT